MLYHKIEFVVWLWSFLHLFPRKKESQNQDMFQFVKKSTCQQSILSLFFFLFFPPNSSPKTRNNNRNWFLTLVYFASQHMIVRKKRTNLCNIFSWYNILHLRFSRHSTIVKKCWTMDGKMKAWKMMVGKMESLCGTMSVTVNACLLNTTSE